MHRNPTIDRTNKGRTARKARIGTIEGRAGRPPSALRSAYFLRAAAEARADSFCNSE